MLHSCWLHQCWLLLNRDILPLWSASNNSCSERKRELIFDLLYRLHDILKFSMIYIKVSLYKETAAFSTDLFYH